MERFADHLPMPAAYFELALRQFGTTQFLRNELLAGTAVSAAQLAAPGAEITLGQQLRQVRNINCMAPGGWALGMGASFHTSTHGPLGFAAVSAATVGDAFDLVARFMHVRNPSHRGEGSLAGGEYRLALVEQTALLAEERIPVVETLLLALQALVEAVLARPCGETRFELGYAAPPWVHRYHECFHGALCFEARQSAIVVPASLCAARSPFADPGTWASALPALEAQARRLDGLDFTAARVELLLQQGGDAPAPLEDVARRLGMSRRSLIRRLQESGAGYRELVDRHRRRRAEALLREGSESVAEIGYRLGYEDSANFARACRRWFGEAPSALRRGGNERPKSVI